MKGENRPSSCLVLISFLMLSQRLLRLGFFFFFPTEYTFLCFKATDRVLAIVLPEAGEELDHLGQVLIVVAVVAQEGSLLVEAVEEVGMCVPSRDKMRPNGTAQPRGLL